MIALQISDILIKSNTIYESILIRIPDALPFLFFLNFNISKSCNGDVFCNNSLNQFNFHYSLKLQLLTKPVVSWQHSFWHSKEGIPKKGAKNLNIIDL